MRRALFSLTSVALTLFAIALIFGSITAAQWQYDRGVARHAANTLIVENTKKSAITESALQEFPKKEIQWRSITITGTFMTDNEYHELLLRNRYNEGKYGFGVISLFTSNSGKSYWVDRGWIGAGKSAQDAPSVPPTNEKEVTITARVRTEDLSRRIEGSFFALPGPNSSTQNALAKWNSEESVVSEPFYFDLISASDLALIPKVPAELPELTDGPHMAYALQWLLFAVLAAFGRVLLVREDLRSRKNLPGI